MRKCRKTLKSRDELAAEIERFNGVAITRSQAADAVELWFVRNGVWQGGQRLAFEAPEGRMISLDSRLRDVFAAVEPRKLAARERQEYLALLSRWFYSSWRDGEWLDF